MRANYKTFAWGFGAIVCVVFFFFPQKGFCFEIVPVSIEKKNIVLGQDESVVISARLPKNIEKFYFTAALGAIENVESLSKTRVRARYIPPKQFRPAYDVILLRGDEEEKLVITGVVIVPLLGRGRARIETLPGAQTHIIIANKIFGPVEADQLGVAYVDITVPPGLNEGIDAHGNRIDLGIPHVSTSALFTLDSEGIEHREERNLKLLLLTFNSFGKLERSSSLVIRPSLGTIVSEQAIAPGIYIVDYKPPERLDKDTITFKIDRDGQVDSHELEVNKTEEFVETIAEEELMPVSKEVQIHEETKPLLVQKDLLLLLSFSGGVCLDFKGWFGASSALQLRINWPGQKLLQGFNLRFGFGKTSESGQFQNEETSLESSSFALIFPFVAGVFTSFEVAEKWVLSGSINAGGAFVYNRMMLSSLNEQVIFNEKRVRPTFGVVLDAGYHLGIGTIILELGGWYLDTRMNLLKGRLFYTDILLGYRLPFLRKNFFK